MKVITGVLLEKIPILSKNNYLYYKILSDYNNKEIYVVVLDEYPSEEGKITVLGMIIEEKEIVKLVELNKERVRIDKEKQDELNKMIIDLLKR